MLDESMKISSTRSLDSTFCITIYANSDSATEPGVSSPEARAGRRACGLGVRVGKVRASLGEAQPAGAG